ncbi:hypothetical protein AVEN_41210-1 [Araneus ventricosus]|uniref:Uncharacterized protein n=1 Tax=Araneus ventricosus TaxID=182803 RepID=A0A4Y2LWK5_ARAVE|nr:hypothetical protein AVEN_91815-1 [Araneus ventricosus]GBN18862.1 hypothetical protein AVEN_41210-1 [Araneus ventricosus]
MEGTLFDVFPIRHTDTKKEETGTSDNCNKIHVEKELLFSLSNDEEEKIEYQGLLESYQVVQRPETKGKEGLDCWPRDQITCEWSNENQKTLLRKTVLLSLKYYYIYLKIFLPLSNAGYIS